MLTLITMAVFTSVALLSGVLLYPLFGRNDNLRERIERLAANGKPRPDLVPIRARWQKLLTDIGSKIRVHPGDVRIYREMVVAAGFRPEGVYVFLGGKLLLAVAVPLGWLALSASHLVRLSGTPATILVAASAIFGYLLPTFWLQHRMKKRKTEIFHSLPDVIDLLTVCVEAGLSLDAALIKTAENFQRTNDPLIAEIRMTTLEMRAGRPRAEALRAMADRTMVDDIKGFVAMLVQTEKFGTSLGRTLRSYSDSLRTKRRQIAEEQAAKTAVKMLIPLTFCVFPALLVVMLAPAIFRIYTMLSRQ